MNATPTKLNNGSWGARVQGNTSTGQQIHIKTKAGKEWDALVDQVLWCGKDKRTGETISLVSTFSLPRNLPRKNHASRNDRYSEEIVHTERDGTKWIEY